MFDTFGELIDAVKSDANIAGESTLFPEATIKMAINRSYIKAGGLFLWEETKWAKRTTTQADQEYYDYPNDFRSKSIYRIEVNGDQYGENPDGSPLRFEDYLVWRKDSNNANSTLKKWSSENRRYFIYPVPTIAGQTIDIWGQKIVKKLVENADVTIFSYSMPECNEAIVLEAVAILKAKGEEESKAEFRSTEAKQILIVAWDKIKKADAKYNKNQPMFEAPDYFSGKNTVKTNTGNF